MSRDFELGTNVSCEESTVSPVPVSHVLSYLYVIFLDNRNIHYDEFCLHSLMRLVEGRSKNVRYYE